MDRTRRDGSIGRLRGAARTATPDELTLRLPIVFAIGPAPPG